VTGVYHAAFVDARLIELYERAGASTGDGSFGARADELRQRFATTCATLRTAARLTASGEALLAEMLERVGEPGSRSRAPATADWGPSEPE
jgi:hypothetical protein